MPNDILIIEAATREHYLAAKELMIEYRETSLAGDYAVGGSGLNEELDNFPGPYRPPAGVLLLAYFQGEPCGCLALRPITTDSGEVMRMYVRPSTRGKGIAERLMKKLIAIALSHGHKTLYLDSLKRFAPAHKLYEKLGFQYCEPYSEDTTEAMRNNMVFMKLDIHQ